jgi:hypothetical protein
MATMRRLACAVALVLSASATPSPVDAQRGPVCADFASQAAAQEAYRSDPPAYARLDRDDDGVACESNRRPYDREPVCWERTAHLDACKPGE